MRTEIQVVRPVPTGRFLGLAGRNRPYSNFRCARSQYGNKKRRMQRRPQFIQLLGITHLDSSSILHPRWDQPLDPCKTRTWGKQRELESKRYILGKWSDFWLEDRRENDACLFENLSVYALEQPFFKGPVFYLCTRWSAQFKYRFLPVNRSGKF